MLSTRQAVRGAVPEAGRELRRFPRAVYFVADDAPVVLAVLHQHRKPQTWRERI
jgi:hypothetical protein